MMKAVQKTHISEAEIQEEFFNKLPLFVKDESLRRLIFAVPNGGSRDPREAQHLKRQGVKRGVADVICLKAGFDEMLSYALAIEFKTAKGKQTNEQKEFQKSCEKHFIKYAVCRSALEALNLVKKYLMQ